jgi:tetratricopeptide (TPR) repeat protein
LGAAVVAAAGSASAQQGASPAPASVVVQQGYDALFKDMYQGPSNLDASFKFAHEAVLRGDYEAAIGALERMLFFNPDLPRVKLELGVLYFKLASYEIARGYLQEAIKGGDVSNDIHTQVMAYLAEVDRRLAKYEYSVFLTSGMRYQTNANIGPNSLQVRALGQDAILDPRYGRRPDWNSFQTISAAYAYKLNLHGDQIESTFLGLNTRQFTQKQFNLGLVEATLGTRVGIGQNASFKYYAIGDKVWLGDASYFDAIGGGLSVRSTLGSFGLIEGYAEARHCRFTDSANYPTASDQSGDLLITAITSDLRFGPVHWAMRLGFDNNNAVTDFSSYKRYSIDVALPIEFALPVFGTMHQFVFAPSAGYSTANYKASNFIVDPDLARRDREYRYGAIFDAQLVDNIGLRTEVTYTKIDSNLPNYRTTNLTASIGPTVRF